MHCRSSTRSGVSADVPLSVVSFVSVGGPPSEPGPAPLVPVAPGPPSHPSARTPSQFRLSTWVCAVENGPKGLSGIGESAASCVHTARFLDHVKNCTKCNSRTVSRRRVTGVYMPMYMSTRDINHTSVARRGCTVAIPSRPGPVRGASHVWSLLRSYSVLAEDSCPWHAACTLSDIAPNMIRT